MINLLLPGVMEKSLSRAMIDKVVVQIHQLALPHGGACLFARSILGAFRQSQFPHA